MLQTQQTSKSCTSAPKNFAELSWMRETDRQNAILAAEEAVREKAARLASVLNHFLFSHWDARTFYVGGKLVQSCMKVANPCDVNEYYLVSCNIETGEEQWSAWAPNGKKHNALLMIEAVQMRVAQNRAQRTVN